MIVFRSTSVEEQYRTALAEQLLAAMSDGHLDYQCYVSSPSIESYCNDSDDWWSQGFVRLCQSESLMDRVRETPRIVTGAGRHHNQHRKHIN